MVGNYHRRLPTYIVNYYPFASRVLTQANWIPTDVRICYVLAGSATGSTFVRIFFKQLHFLPPSNPHPRGISLDQCPSSVTAGIPAQPIAKWLLNTYIARVHVWWPFLSLPHLRRVFLQIYQEPAQCNDFEKFLVFIVLALASNESTERGEYLQMRDLNTPLGYFQASLRFYADCSRRGRELSSLQGLLLLGIWMLSSNLSGDHDDLWQLSRYAMSLAIETGLHRHNADWIFTADELEIRNRTWWSVYALERYVSNPRILIPLSHTDVCCVLDKWQC